MKRKLLLLLCLLSVLSFSPVGSEQVAGVRDERRPLVSTQRGLARQHETVLPYAAGRLLLKLTDEAVRVSHLRNMGRQKGTLQNDARTGIASLDAISRDAGAHTISRPYIELQREVVARQIGVDRWFMLQVQEVDLPALAARYAGDPNVEAVSLDWRAFPSVVPNDPLYSSNWGHDNSGQLPDYCWFCGGHASGSPVGTAGFDADADLAWDAAQGYGDASTIIAILDTGVDVGHPDLRLVPGWDYGSDDSDPNDDSAAAGHGTAVAGVAAAIANNGIGVAGVAGGASVMPLKVADDAGQLFFSYVQNALYHAADNGAHIASMSFGADIANDQATDDAIRYADNAGVTLLSGTGNDNAPQILYPANNRHVIAVGAASPCGGRKRSSDVISDLNPGVYVDPNGYTCDAERWWGSSYGSATQDAADAVAVIAPTILSTTDIRGSGGYDDGDYFLWFNGTSCATPYAAGVCALILAANPGADPSQVRQQLQITARDVIDIESVGGWDPRTGYGLVNAAAAVGSTPPPPISKYATLPYATGFESGELDRFWTTVFTGDGRMRILTAGVAHSGLYHLLLDDATSGGFSQAEAWLRLDLAGRTDVELSFWRKDFGEETHAEDGVFLSDDGGASFVKVLDFTDANSPDDVWQPFSVNVNQVAAANGLTLSGTFVVKFQQYDDYPIPVNGYSLDDVTVTSGGVTERSVNVTAPAGGETFTPGDVVNVTWSSTGPVNDVSIEHSTDGGSTWESVVASTPNDGAHPWVVPSRTTTQGKIRIADVSNSTISHVSNGSFTITGAPAGDYAVLPYSTGFESGRFDSFWSSSSTANGRIQLVGNNGPHSGSFHLTMDDATSGGFSQNEAWLRLNLAGHDQVELVFWWKEFGDETHVQDGVFFSDDGGASFVKAVELNGQSYPNNSWHLLSADIDELATTLGLSLSNTFVVKFQQYDDHPMLADGHAIDDISVVVAAQSQPGEYTRLPYSTSFETGGLDSYWSTRSTGSGRVQLQSASGPRTGTTHLTMDSAVNSSFAQNEAWLRLDLSSETNVRLDFWWKEFGDEVQVQDGVYFSDDAGATFVKVFDLNAVSVTNETWQSIVLDVDDLAARKGLRLTRTFLVKFQQYDNYPIPVDGYAIDDVSVTRDDTSNVIVAEAEPNGNRNTASGPVGLGVSVSGAITTSSDDDWYYIDVAVGGNVNITLDIGAAADLDWFLYDTNNSKLAQGYSTNDPEVGSVTLAAGRYHVFVDGYRGATSGYTLTATSGPAQVVLAPTTPKEIALHANFPNPFNPRTTIKFDIPQRGHVSLQIYDVRGRVIGTLVDQIMDPGYHVVVWNGLDFQGHPAASGTYLYKLVTDGFSDVRKMLLMK